MSAGASRCEFKGSLMRAVQATEKTVENVEKNIYHYNVT